jgi:diguanylate cyclase (GGDEF)-like protein
LLEPARPDDEIDRLKSLHSLKLLDTPSEERFDRVTRLAQRLFGIETCLISLVDEHRQWFKSRQGLDACETKRDVSFCGHAILDDDAFVVTDARLDQRFADNPLVIGPPHVRFYAGRPLRGPGGHRIGTLCLIDSRPRTLDREGHETLRDLTAMVEDELTLLSRTTIDDLTQVANRRGFNGVAGHMIELFRRTEMEAELVFFDLDRFKGINDEFGHATGDDLLQHFAELLLKCFRSADVVARLGGDEFAVLMAGPDGDFDEALRRLERLAAEDASETRRRLRWSVGRVRFDPERHSSIEQLLADADAEMYRQKARRRGAGE